MDDPMMNDYEVTQQPGPQSEAPRYSCLWEREKNPERVLFKVLSYRTRCGKATTLEFGPFETGFKFCPYCGGELLVAPTGKL